MKTRFSATLLVVLLCTVGLAQETSLPDAQRAFAWFDKLGFPDFAGASLVHVEDRAREPRFVDDFLSRENCECYGLLFEDGSGGFRFLTLDLIMQPEASRVRELNSPWSTNQCFTKLDLGEECAALLDAASEGKKLASGWFRWIFDRRLHRETRVFLLGRACAAAGHTRQANGIRTPASSRLPRA